MAPGGRGGKGTGLARSRVCGGLPSGCGTGWHPSMPHRHPACTCRPRSALQSAPAAAADTSLLARCGCEDVVGMPTGDATLSRMTCPTRGPRRTWHRTTRALSCQIAAPRCAVLFVCCRSEKAGPVTPIPVSQVPSAALQYHHQQQQAPTGGASGQGGGRRRGGSQQQGQGQGDGAQDGSGTGVWTGMHLAGAASHIRMTAEVSHWWRRDVMKVALVAPAAVAKSVMSGGSHQALATATVLAVRACIFLLRWFGTTLEGGPWPASVRYPFLDIDLCCAPQQSCHIASSVPSLASQANASPRRPYTPMLIVYCRSTLAVVAMPVATGRTAGRGRVQACLQASAAFRAS